MRFTVKLGTEVVGSSLIDSGGQWDAHMASSSRHPRIVGFSNIGKHRESWQTVPGLTGEEARGIPLECSAGFQIVDFSPEFGSEGIQLHLLGITTPPYVELFPNDLKNRDGR